MGLIWVPEDQVCALNGLVNMFKGKRKAKVNRLNCPVFGKEVIRPF
jgi:hypothetical protein